MGICLGVPTLIGVTKFCIDYYSGDVESNKSNLTSFHGRLKIQIFGARDLPDTDAAFFNIDGKDYTDPYVIGDLGTARLFKTRYICNSLNPEWKDPEEIFDVYVCHQASSLKIQVKDKDYIGSAFVGSTSIKGEDLVNGEVVEGWFDLMNEDQLCGQINLCVQYIPKVKLDENSHEIYDSYFKPREGCRMILYQDADTPQLKQFDGLCHPDGSPYVATRAWKDMYDCIKNAEKFIYITGWSVFTAINLLRGEEDPDGLSNVGELLKSKADEGVHVLLLIWNERTSTDIFAGMMGTHDEETQDFFTGTNVECLLVSRENSDGVLADAFVGTCYTHHQKTIICDTEYEEDNSMRRIIAFIGGLDITNGRYDTPEFPLFKTCKTVHQGVDFYQNCAVGVTEDTGPRQPWHDIHAKVEGPIALDIMKNFEERWIRQSEDLEHKLFDINHSSDFILDAPAAIPDYEDSPWTIQLFRSITSDSAKLCEEKKHFLYKKGGRFVENSIQNCMVRQIRNAKNFIYLENQYFLGSAYSWLNDNETLSDHLIPRELTERIIEKIAESKPFKVYVVVPMFPEGDPSSAAIQEILFWQYRTMETMYKMIASAIDENDAGTHPKDYLMFFCLAKRESRDEVPDDLIQPESGSLAETLRRSMRHCIYVHSKMSIFDDEYILVGSANINQRSLGGERDTEIAAGGYQPGHTVEDEVDPRGSVHTFRMALWSAHFGGYDEAYLNPASEDCLTKIREKSQAFWELYIADEPEHSDCHILPYPINIDQDGNVTPLKAPYDCFPDSDASVLGSKSSYLPEKLTT